MTNEESPSPQGVGAPSEADPARPDRLRGMIAGGRIPLDELVDDIDGVQALIKSGEAMLEVVAFPWGLSFSVVAAPAKKQAPLVPEPIAMS